MFWQKKSITRYSLTMNGHGGTTYEQKSGYYWTGPFISKTYVKIHFDNGDLYYIHDAKPQEIHCSRTYGEQPGRIVPHEAVSYWKGEISPDQSKTMKDDLIEALRQYLQNYYEEAQATYLSITSAWAESVRGKQQREDALKAALKAEK
jgi:hypothetical protein